MATVIEYLAPDCTFNRATYYPIEGDLEHCHCCGKKLNHRYTVDLGDKIVVMGGDCAANVTNNWDHALLIVEQEDPGIIEWLKAQPHPKNWAGRTAYDDLLFWVNKVRGRKAQGRKAQGHIYKYQGLFRTHRDKVAKQATHELAMAPWLERARVAIEVLGVHNPNYTPEVVARSIQELRDNVSKGHTIQFLTEVYEKIAAEAVERDKVQSQG